MKKFEEHARTDTYGSGTLVALELGRIRGSFFRDNAPDVEPEDQSFVVVFNGKRIVLSSMTEPELDALLEFWKLAVEGARTHVMALDRQAVAAQEAGGPIYKRLYRPLPILVDFRQEPDETE